MSNVILSNPGDDFLSGGAGVDTISYSSATAGVTVSLALQGSAQNTVGAGVDTLSNFQNLIGSGFNDTLAGDANNNVIDGGAGINTVSYNGATSGVTVSLALQGSTQDTIGAGVDTLSNFQNLRGSAFADHLTGDANNNVIDGGSGGNDILDGGGGVNTVSFAHSTFGVTVNLALQGSAQHTIGAGFDTLTNFQNLTGSPFNDVLLGDANNNVLDGGAGVDTISYASATAGVAVSLALQGAAQNTVGAGLDTLISFQNLTGSSFDDTLSGDANNNVVDGGGGGNDILDGGGGVNTASFAHAASGVSVNLALQGSAQNTIGADIDTLRNFQNLTGSAFNDTLSGDSGNNVLTGGGGNDILQGGGGSNTLDGGAGIDTALYTGLSRAYAVSASAGVASVAGGPVNSVDNLVNVERIQFVDGYLDTGTGDPAAQVYRLYGATLNRGPDPQGLTDWTQALTSGATLASVVGGFVNSTEFQNRYGTLNNTDFVTLLYSHVLGRDPDPAGLANWVGALNGGASRAGVVLGFSESPEYIGDTTLAVQQGLWIADTQAAEVARLYDTVFSRLPDAGGEAAWTQMIDSGSITLLQATQGFVASAEFQSTYGALDDSHFIQLLYQNALHRPADPTGLTNWTSYLASGHSRAEVVLGFSDSAEHIASTAAHINNGVWFA